MSRVKLGCCIGTWVLFGAAWQVSAEDAPSRKQLVRSAGLVISGAQALMQDIDSMRTEAVSKNAPDELSCLNDVYDVASSNLDLAQGLLVDLEAGGTDVDPGYSKELLESYNAENDAIRRSAAACRGETVDLGLGAGTETEVTGPTLSESADVSAWIADDAAGLGADVAADTTSASGVDDATNGSDTTGGGSFDAPPPASVGLI